MGDDWPAWATERIELAEPADDWGERAGRLAAEVTDLLGTWLDGGIEHVGSTAVPGLPAKPILDLMAPVRGLDVPPEVEVRLADAGWALVPPELDRRPWRRLHVLPEGGRRVAHLQLIEPAHRRWRETIAFREALRADPDLAARYAAVKRSAAGAHADDREAYTAAKSDFIRDAVAGRGP